MDRLSERDYASLTAGGEAIKHMREGVKVWRLPDGRIVKLFRPRNRLSRSRLLPPNRRFSLNAFRLQKLGFESVEVLKLFVLKANGCFGVVYRGVPGTTLEASLREDVSTEQIDLLAQLLARLHHAGVLFRSLHPGNLVVSGTGGLALIDVEEVKFRSRPLTVAARVRNFRHLLRRPVDRELIDAIAYRHLVDGYLHQSDLSPSSQSKLRRRLIDLQADIRGDS